MTLRDDLTLFVVSRYTIWTVPCTVLTPYTGVIIMDNDTCLTDLYIRLCRTTDETSRINTVVTAHRVKEHQGVWKSPCLHLTDTAPLDISGIVVLLITSDLTTAAPDTSSCIKMKTVLLTLLQVRNIDGVVSTLHPGVSLVTDKIF
jgi:hypothetical protein